MSTGIEAAKRIIVTLSTGNQGASTVRALAKRNEQAGKNVYTILAVTRDAQSGKAKKLAALPGVELIESEYDEKAIFKKATQDGKLPVYGVFSVQSFMGLPKHVAKGPEGETQLGNLLADEAKRNNVQHFVYTSVERGATNKTDIPHFESKRLIEEHIEKIDGFNWTILQPVAFMDNLSNGETMMQRISNTFFTAVLQKPVQFIAAKDIGEFAALSFDKPDEFIGRKIGLANDEAGPKEIQELYQNVKGKQLPTTFGFIARTLVSLNGDFNKMFKFFNSSASYDVKMDELRKMNPNMLTLRQYMETEM